MTQRANSLPGDNREPAATDGALRQFCDEATFRKVLGNVPTSVSIVTGDDGEGHFGIIIGSLVSISLEPPLVGFFIDNRSRTLGRVLACERLCINILSAEQARFCREFSVNRSDRFSCGNWQQVQGQAPRLDRALAWVAGRLEQFVEIGDHHLIVIEPDWLAENPACAASDPLVFFRGAFAS
jgi:3-hydroxy-9,10-secoandrosta-1,3,5(10)-triene-9,17-dione monooxygenase reductase component